MSWNDLTLIIFPLAYLDLIFRCRKYKKRIKDLESENEDLRSKIEWGIHNM